MEPAFEKVLRKWSGPVSLP